MAKSNKKSAVAAETPAVTEPVAAVPVEAVVDEGGDDQSGGDDKKKRVVNAVPTEFVKLLKDDMGDTKLSSKDIKAVAESFVRILVSQIKSGSSVSFTNNMTFKRALRGDRTHKNPKTGEEVFKKAHYVMCMDVKPALKKVFEDIKVTKEEAAKAETEPCAAEE